MAAVEDGDGEEEEDPGFLQEDLEVADLHLLLPDLPPGHHQNKKFYCPETNHKESKHIKI